MVLLRLDFGEVIGNGVVFIYTVGCEQRFLNQKIDREHLKSRTPLSVACIPRRHPLHFDLPRDFASLKTGCLRMLGGTPVRCFHLMHPQFPTPMIISFIPQSFLTGTNSYRPRCAWDGQSVLCRLWHLPSVAFVAIDRKGDKTPVAFNHVIDGPECRSLSILDGL